MEKDLWASMQDWQWDCPLLWDGGTFGELQLQQDK